MANKKPKTLGKTQRAGFDKGQPQPTPEQKKAGRERKKQARKIMEEMMKYQDMTLSEFEKHLENNKSELKIGELITAKRTREILKDKNIMKYRIDKHVPNAPQNIELEHSGGIEGIITEGITNKELDQKLNLLLGR